MNMTAEIWINFLIKKRLGLASLKGQVAVEKMLKGSMALAF
jgi:hypothetical protein